MCRSAADGGRRCHGSVTKANEAARKQRHRMTRHLAKAIAAVANGDGADPDIEPWGVKLAEAEERVRATAHTGQAQPPDRLRQMTQDTFQYGQCHALALALHEHTGWPVWAMKARDGGETHFLVRAPDGRLVDITGAHDIAAMETTWTGCTATPTTAGRINSLIARNDMETPLMNLARAVLPQVLVKAQGDGTSPHPSTAGGSPATPPRRTP